MLTFLPIEQIASRWIVGSDPDAVVAEIKRETARHGLVARQSRHRFVFAVER